MSDQEDQDRLAVNITWPCSHYDWMKTECRREHPGNIEAWCRNCLRNSVTRLTQENARLKAELAAAKPKLAVTRQRPPFYFEADE